MIFVTTGTQLPFDRLLSIIDKSYKLINQDVIAQASTSSVHIENFNVNSTYSREEFETIFNSADIIIAHAGMGTILTALKLNKKLIIFPRLSKYNEHRNDHQIATANHMKSLPNVLVAETENRLLECILQMRDLNPSPSSEHLNRKQFIEKLSSCIHNYIEN